MVYLIYTERAFAKGFCKLLPKNPISVNLLPTMSVRMRHTRAHTRNRRSHHAIGTPATTTGSGSIALRHRVSPVDGTYKGKEIIDVKTKIEKKATKKAEIKKQLKEQKAPAKIEAKKEDKKTEKKEESKK